MWNVCYNLLSILYESRRGGRVVEGGGLESRCTVLAVPRVRIPPSPPSFSVLFFSSSSTVDTVRPENSYLLKRNDLARRPVVTKLS